MGQFYSERLLEANFVVAYKLVYKTVYILSSELWEENYEGMLRLVKGLSLMYGR